MRTDIFVLSGATLSGKTWLMLKILREAQKIFNPCPKLIILLYGQLQDDYLLVREQLSEQGITLHLVKGYDISLNELSKQIDRDQQTLVIADDMTETTAKSSHMAELFMNGRHANISVWLLWHTLYPAHKEACIISQNASYYFFLASQRLIGQLKCFTNQTGFDRSLVIAAFQDATALPNRYLFIDLRATTPAPLRVRTNILPSDDLHYVYRCI